MASLEKHYHALIGLDENWTVQNVDLDIMKNSVVIKLLFKGKKVVCPVCDDACSIADHAPERSWRHLDTMQFETILTARVPRSRCKKCGVKTVGVPWADKNGRFTLMFEAFVIKVLQACSSTSAAVELVKIDWKTANEIMKRAVAKGLLRRDTDELLHLGIDEKSFRKGHNYVSVLTDIDGSRVLDVVEGRKEENADELLQTLPKEQRDKVAAVAMDMWPAFINSAEKNLPEAEIVHDKFHVSKHLNEAVDKVRRSEHKALKEVYEKSPLTSSKYLWLSNPEDFREETQVKFAEVKKRAELTARAWSIKESFADFWHYVYPENARDFFDSWYGWAIRSRLDPIKKSAKMLKAHLDNLVTYCSHRITNAASEGFNSKIQSIKANARGLKVFASYRVRILFYCGKLDMQPLEEANTCH
jgi:transposase